MNQDRTKICKIISEMINNPNEHGIYSTTETFEKLEAYIDHVRFETLGWMYAYACSSLDKGQDIRKDEVPQIMDFFTKSVTISDK